MLRILPLADDLILPQARQEIYFFNRIGRLRPVEGMQCPVKSRANAWSCRMQITGQWQCKRVVKWNANLQPPNLRKPGLYFHLPGPWQFPILMPCPLTPSATCPGSQHLQGYGAVPLR
jgi:hypothetical protein